MYSEFNVQFSLTPSLFINDHSHLKGRLEKLTIPNLPEELKDIITGGAPA
jgi:hypothetical protein